MPSPGDPSPPLERAAALSAGKCPNRTNSFAYAFAAALFGFELGLEIGFGSAFG